MIDIWNIVIAATLASVLAVITYLGYKKFSKEGFTFLRSSIKQELIPNDFIPVRNVRPMNTPHIDEVLPKINDLRTKMKISPDLAKQRSDTARDLKKMTSDHKLIARAKRPVYRSVIEQVPQRFYGGLFRNGVGRDPVKAEKAMPFLKVPVYISPPLDVSLDGMRYLDDITGSIKWRGDKEKSIIFKR